MGIFSHRYLDSNNMNKKCYSWVYIDPSELYNRHQSHINFKVEPPQINVLWYSCVRLIWHSVHDVIHNCTSSTAIKVNCKGTKLNHKIGEEKQHHVTCQSQIKNNWYKLLTFLLVIGRLNKFLAFVILVIFFFWNGAQNGKTYKVSPKKASLWCVAAFG